MMIFPIYGSTRSLVVRGFLIRVRHCHYKSLSLEGATYSETIKKSKFMCVAKSCFSPIEASKILDKIKDDKANHHCWAFKIGDLEKCDDDGEPSGSAGSPILSAIKNQNLQNVIVVVKRYFGGVKLGMGGLVRAYGGVARKCLADAAYVQLSSRILLQVTADMSLIDRVYSVVTNEKAVTILLEEVTNDNIIMTLEVDEEVCEKFRASLTSSLQGSVNIEQHDTDLSI